MRTSAIFILVTVAAVRKDSDGDTSRSAVRASQHQQGNGFEDDFNESMGDTEEFPDDARGIQDARSILMRPQNQTFSVPSWESYPAKLWMESFTGLWSAPMCKSRSPYECINEEKMRYADDFYEYPFAATCFISVYDDTKNRCSKTIKCLQRLWKENIGFLCPDDYPHDTPHKLQTYLIHNMEALLAAYDGNLLRNIAQNTLARFEDEWFEQKQLDDERQKAARLAQQFAKPKHLYILRFEWVPLIPRRVARLPNGALAGTFQCQYWNPVYKEGEEKHGHHFTKKYEEGTAANDVYWSEFRLFAKKHFSPMMDIPEENANNLVAMCQKCFPSNKDKCTKSVGSHLVPGSGVVKIYVAVDDGPLVGPEQSKFGAAMQAAKKSLDRTATQVGMLKLLKSTLQESSWTDPMWTGLSSEIRKGTSYYPKLNYLKIPIAEEAKFSNGFEIGKFVKELAWEIKYC